jgi:hypothetical protein
LTLRLKGPGFPLQSLFVSLRSTKKVFPLQSLARVNRFAVYLAEFASQTPGAFNTPDSRP